MIATPDQNELKLYIDNLVNRLTYNYKQSLINKFNQFSMIKDRYNENKFINNLNILNNKVLAYEKQLELLSPIKKIDDNITLLNNNYNRLNESFNKIIMQDDIKINHMIDKLILLNPLNVMKKGYSIIYKDNNAISSVNDIMENDIINIKLQDGSINAKVLEKR